MSTHLPWFQWFLSFLSPFLVDQMSNQQQKGYLDFLVYISVFLSKTVQQSKYIQTITYVSPIMFMFMVFNNGWTLCILKCCIIPIVIPRRLEFKGSCNLSLSLCLCSWYSTMAGLFVTLNCCIIPIVIPRKLELKGCWILRMNYLFTHTNVFQNIIEQERALSTLEIQFKAIVV